MQRLMVSQFRLLPGGTPSWVVIFFAIVAAAQTYFSFFLHRGTGGFVL
ncbi:MAG: hypothetical protein ACXVAG_16450 [Vulcanimicrobiaceae bacterium]